MTESLGRPLTPRQLQVLALMAQGMDAAEIAELLHLSETTIRNFKREIYTKLAARNGLHAVALAYERGILAGGVAGALGEDLSEQLRILQQAREGGFRLALVPWQSAS